MTPCPLALDERHDWQVDPETSDLACMRYVCACGRRAWRQRALPGRPRVGAPIREYASSAGRPAKRPELKPDATTAKPHPGSNATGHKLPASSTSRRD